MSDVTITPGIAAAAVAVLLAVAEVDMESEVEVYDQYLRGEVYGYTLYEQEEDEWVEQESCWGFYGDDLLENGITDDAGEGFADALKNDAYEQGKATVRTVTCYDFG